MIVEVVSKSYNSIIIISHVIKPQHITDIKMDCNLLGLNTRVNLLCMGDFNRKKINMPLMKQVHIGDSTFTWKKTK